MSHRGSVVGAERQRVENVLCILTAIADRLETTHELAPRVIGDAFEFVRAYEQEGLDDTGTSAGEPHLRLTVDHHLAARIPVRGMHQAVVALDRGDTSARDRFARYAREYSAPQTRALQAPRPPVLQAALADDVEPRRGRRQTRINEHEGSLRSPARECSHPDHSGAGTPKRLKPTPKPSLRVTSRASQQPV